MNDNLILEAVCLPFFWLFVFLFVTSIGFATIPFRKQTGSLSSNPFTIFWYGLGFCIAFLQIWNLFLPVTKYCWICLLPITVWGCLKFFKPSYPKQKIIKPNILVYIFLFVILLFLSISSLDNTFIYDSLVYHFYTIKWYNTYPVVPGMGNLFIYLGLNQSFFLFPAFLNSLWINYKGACSTNGLLAIIVCSEIVVNNLRGFLKNERLSFYSFFQLLFLPLCINVGVQNLSSPTPDVFVNLFTFKILSDLIRCIEKNNVSFQDIFFLLFFCLMGIVLKMSFIGVAIGIIAVSIWWLYSLKLWKTNLVLSALLIYLFLLIPWAIRGIISSGYIAFPISFMGFPVDWKMPKEILIGLSAFIKGFARSHLHGQGGIDAAYNYNWFPGWVKRMLTTGGFIIPIILLILTIVGLKIKKINISKLILILTPIFISIIFWFFTAPDIRFAVFTFWALGIIPLAYFLSHINIRWVNNICFIAFISVCSLLIMIKNWNTDPELLGSLPKQDNSVFTTKSGLKINTIKGTPPGDDWQIGDCTIPCSVFPDSNLVLRGNGVEKGFKLSSIK